MARFQTEFMERDGARFALCVSVGQIDIRVLEATFRGYPRKTPRSWALHYNIAFACMTDGIPHFLAKHLAEVKGFFQLPQHCCSMGLWGQFESIQIHGDNEIEHGPGRVWRTHAQVNVARNQLYDAWARVKLVYTFRRLELPIWFKVDAAFRCVYVENLEKRWGADYCNVDNADTTLCYSGNDSAFSMGCW